MARWQPARADVIAEYAREVLTVHPRGRLLVGVDGIEHPADSEPPSSREAFAADLAAAFRAEGVPAHADRLAPFASGAPGPEGWYDLARLRDEVLTPFRAGLLGEPSVERQVLVLSGPFAHLPDLAGVWHTSAWIALPRAEARRRDAERLRGPEDAPALDGWYRLVDTAFRRLDARKRARATFDLTDPAHPHREFEDAC